MASLWTSWHPSDTLNWKNNEKCTLGLHHQRSPAIPGPRSQRRTASRTASALSRKWLCWALLGANSTSARSSKSAPTHIHTHTHIYIYIYTQSTSIHIYIYTYDDSYVYQVHENKHDITLHHITLRTPVYSYTCRVYSILCASVNWGCIRTMEVGHYLGVKKRFPGFEPYPFMYESFPVSR